VSETFAVLGTDCAGHVIIVLSFLRSSFPHPPNFTNGHYEWPTKEGALPILVLHRTFFQAGTVHDALQ